MFELKLLDKNAVPAALEKALRYRLLNEPEQAASICEDVLNVESNNQEAIAALILALTDQFGGSRPGLPMSARELTSKLKDAYEREYYAGIVWEREALARLRSNAPKAGPAAFDCFREAMICFERAAAMSPPANNDAVLRWNFCARMIDQNPEIAPADDGVEVAASLGE